MAASYEALCYISASASPVCLVFVLQRSGGSCYLSSLSTVSMFSHDLSQTLPEVFVSHFGYFRVWRSF